MIQEIVGDNTSGGCISETLILLNNYHKNFFAYSCYFIKLQSSEQKYYHNNLHVSSGEITFILSFTHFKV